MNCPECNSENLVKRGFRGGHQRYVCKDCDRHFTEGVKLKPRMPKTPLEGEVCPHCGSTEIKRDGKLETGGQRFKCVTCGRGFSEKTVLYKPVEYKCPHCGGRLKRAGHSKEGKPKYRCADCGKYSSGNPPTITFAFKEVNKDIKCLYCGSTNLKRGGKSRKGYLRYICLDCQKTFNEQTAERLQKLESEMRRDETCPRCGGHNIKQSTPSRTGKEQLRCLDCHKTYLKGSTRIAKDIKRKPLAEQDKRKVLMYRFNFGLPIMAIAESFKCSDYAVKKLIKESGLSR